MNIFNVFKSNFNKTEAKQELSSLAYKASSYIKSNQLMLTEEKLLREYYDLTKNLLAKYSTASALSSSSTNTKQSPSKTKAVVKDLNDIIKKLRITNDHLKLDIHAITQKINNSIGLVATETNELQSELEQAKEELFFTENNLLIKEFRIQKTKKEIEGVNIVQEYERDVIINDPDKSTIYFNTENLVMQETLIKISKDLNKETTRRNDLFKEYKTLKKEQKMLLSNIVNKTKGNKVGAGIVIKATPRSVNDTNSNTSNHNKNNNFVGNNNQEFYNPDNSFDSSKDDKEKEKDKDDYNDENENDKKIQEKTNEDNDLLNNISFDSFSIDNSQLVNENCEQTTLFPNKVQMPNLNINGIKDINSDRKDLNNNNPHLNNNVNLIQNIIPKLDLKQIEYNKSTVKAKRKDPFSNENMVNEEDDDKNDDLKNDKKKVIKETDQRDIQIQKLRKDIEGLIRKKNNIKEIIKKFKAFYQKMCAKYNRLQLKYLNETGLNCEIDEQEEEDKFNHLCTVIQQEITTKTKTGK